MVRGRGRMVSHALAPAQGKRRESKAEDRGAGESERPVSGDGEKGLGGGSLDREEQPGAEPTAGEEGEVKVNAEEGVNEEGKEEVSVEEADEEEETNEREEKENFDSQQSMGEVGPKEGKRGEGADDIDSPEDLPSTDPFTAAAEAEAAARAAVAVEEEEEGEGEINPEEMCDVAEQAAEAARACAASSRIGKRVAELGVSGWGVLCDCAQCVLRTGRSAASKVSRVGNAAMQASPPLPLSCPRLTPSNLPPPTHHCYPYPSHLPLPPPLASPPPTYLLAPLAVP